MQGQNYNPYTGAPLSGIDPPAGYPQKSRIAAGLFGMLMGTFGVHNFYLGNTQRGLIHDFGRYARRASHLRSFHSCRVGLEPC